MQSEFFCKINACLSRSYTVPWIIKTWWILADTNLSVYNGYKPSWNSWFSGKSVSLRPRTSCLINLLLWFVQQAAVVWSASCCRLIRKLLSFDPQAAVVLTVCCCGLRQMLLWCGNGRVGVVMMRYCGFSGHAKRVWPVTSERNGYKKPPDLLSGGNNSCS